MSGTLTKTHTATMTDGSKCYNLLLHTLLCFDDCRAWKLECLSSNLQKYFEGGGGLNQGCELDRFLTEFEFRRYLQVQVRVQKNFFSSSSSSSAKTIEFAPLTISLFINATWKEFWSLLILVLTDLYNCFFNVL